MEFAGRFTVSILLRTRDRANRPCYDGGSGLLMAVGEKRWLVTAWHVLERFRTLYAEDAATLFDVSGYALQPWNRIVSEDATTDLAVVDVANVQFPRRDPNMQPPEYFEMKLPGNEVAVDDRVFFFGWPGAYRHESNDRMTVYIEADAIMNVPVTGVSEHEFCMKFDRTRWESFLSPSSRKSTSYVQDDQLGGHSGAPVFRISPDGDRPELVGFVKEYRSDDAVICSPITKMRSNGTIKGSGIVVDHGTT